MQNKTKRLVLMAMLTAISVVLVLLIRLPLFPAAPYLEYDMADVPVLLASFVLGPGAGLAVLVAASAIQAFMLGGNGLIGFIMHVCASGALVLLAPLIWRAGGRTLPALIGGLAVGTCAMALLMLPLNFIFTPVLFFDVPIAESFGIFVSGGAGEFSADAVAAYGMVRGLLWVVLLPFNLVKAGLNSVIFCVLFRALRPALKQYM
ncbi:MAG: ECF transporter S component [Firmicutes bacterium]|nr:ECF transporter S component [Bacillota bacterium]